MLFGMGNYSVIFFIRKITHPGTVQEWMRLYSAREERVWFTAPGSYQQIPLCSGGKKIKTARTNYVGPFPVNVNTSGHVDGDRAAVSNAGEIPTEAERYIDARSFEVHSQLRLLGGGVSDFCGF